MKNVKITKDNVAALLRNVRAMQEEEVLIGYPEDGKLRKAGDGISNAALAFIHNNGSTLNNIPARPFLAPGVERASDGVQKLLRKAAERALEDPAEVRNGLERAGLFAVSEVKKVLTENNFTPLAPATLRRRRKQGFEGDKALIRTGQLLNAVTYVVRKK